MNLPLCGEAEALRRLDPDSIADAFWSFGEECEAEAVYLEERGESEVRDEWFA